MTAATAHQKERAEAQREHPQAHRTFLRTHGTEVPGSRALAGPSPANGLDCEHRIQGFDERSGHDVPEAHGYAALLQSAHVCEGLCR